MKTEQHKNGLTALDCATVALYVMTTPVRELIGLAGALKNGLAVMKANEAREAQWEAERVDRLTHPGKYLGQ
jgi:hypothetical protein